METDYFKKSLNVGDYVVYMNTMYKRYEKGIVIKLGKKKATLVRESYNYSEQNCTHRHYHLLIKIPKALAEGENVKI